MRLLHDLHRRRKSLYGNMMDIRGPMASLLQLQVTMTILTFSRTTAGKINRWRFALLSAGFLALGTGAGAQGFPRGLPQGIPRGIPRQEQGVPLAYRPPAGMCRIWIDGVPPGQQPAPTDCVTAVRNRPDNGRVIFGEEVRRRGKDKPKKGKSENEDSSAPGY